MARSLLKLLVGFSAGICLLPLASLASGSVTDEYPNPRTWRYLIGEPNTQIDCNGSLLGRAQQKRALRALILDHPILGFPIRYRTERWSSEYTVESVWDERDAEVRASILRQIYGDVLPKNAESLVRNFIAAALPSVKTMEAFLPEDLQALMDQKGAFREYIELLYQMVAKVVPWPSEDVIEEAVVVSSSNLRRLDTLDDWLKDHDALLLFGEELFDDLQDVQLKIQSAHQAIHSPANWRDFMGRVALLERDIANRGKVSRAEALMLMSPALLGIQNRTLELRSRTETLNDELARLSAKLTAKLAHARQILQRLKESKSLDSIPENLFLARIEILTGAKPQLDMMRLQVRHLEDFFAKFDTSARNVQSLMISPAEQTLFLTKKSAFYNGLLLMKKGLSQ